MFDLNFFQHGYPIGCVDRIGVTLSTTEMGSSTEAYQTTTDISRDTASNYLTKHTSSKQTRSDSRSNRNCNNHMSSVHQHQINHYNHVMNYNNNNNDNDEYNNTRTISDAVAKVSNNDGCRHNNKDRSRKYCPKHDNVKETRSIGFHNHMLANANRNNNGSLFSRHNRFNRNLLVRCSNSNVVRDQVTGSSAVSKNRKLYDDSVLYRTAGERPLTQGRSFYKFTILVAKTERSRIN